MQLQTIKDEKDEREKELEAVKSELRKSVDALNGKDSEIESLKKELKSASESSADALNGKDEEIEALKNELKNSLKFSNPIHAEPTTPCTALKSLKAICAFQIGTYLKMM